MHRLIVVILAAVDAAIAAAVGLAVILAPLTLVWVFAFGGAADWGSLWPATATIWQFGHAVPLEITLSAEYLARTGIDPSAASFVLSLAPLAFGVFTAVFAARSGRRASRAGAWITGVVTGTLVFAAIAAATASTGATPFAAVETWHAILFPVLFYALPALVGGVVTEWIEAGDGGVARLRDLVEERDSGWADVPALIARGSAVVAVGLVGVGALGLTVVLWARGGEIIALFEASHVDALGATLVTLGQLAYLPTLVVWAISFIAGPGFAIGAQTTVGPAGTQVGVLPGIPVFGAVPDTATPWLLLLALLPVAVGAFAGWIARSRLATVSDTDHDAMAPRLAIVLGIAVVPAALIALLAFLASGALGPGSLAQVGPAPGPVALAVGLEAGLGAAILLLSPRRRGETIARDSADDVSWSMREEETDATEPALFDDSNDTEPALFDDANDTEPLDREELSGLFGTRPLDSRGGKSDRGPSVD
ncbi:DUF6350 family protein [Microbacterium sp. SLBN-146]|uniref:cell division protein PerM n=1 Tax=Microbacterium sp. SLBN-146 TaxID=2768457 RepID=UPI001151003E|nr:DUF6350 family protein [Microbacterium sp. SLBN-146]TQJ29600.1 hypothetical protein FBY39_0043 [Microbacterium sp. SLBN-146]